jgi:ribosomal protein S18 acetylase RimI-like enzyme
MKDVKNLRFDIVSGYKLRQTVGILADEIWHEYYERIIGKAQVDYMLSKFQTENSIAGQINEGYIYYLIKNGRDDYIGYIGVFPDKDSLFLSKIYLKKSFREKGYGRRAMDFVCNIAREKKRPKITLTVNKNNSRAIKAYEAMGFKNKGPRVTDIGSGFIMDDFLFERELQ